MIRSLRLLAALGAALVLGALTVAPAIAATRAGGPTPATDPSQQVSTLQQQIQQQQQQLQQQLTTLNSLADQEESEQASVTALNSKVSVDQQREQALNQELDRVARIEYERPAVTLTTVMAARNLGELLSGMAQARVISNQQQQLFNAATALRASDERDQAAAQGQLDKISKQQAQSNAIAAKTRTEISTLQAQQQAAEQAAQQQAAEQAAQQQAAQQQAAEQQAAQKEAAQQQAAQQQAAQQQQKAPAPTPAPSSSSSTSGSPPAATAGSVQAIIEGAFAPLGATAQQWGLCIAYHESGDNPNAVQPGAGGAEGLFQFEPSTWATTPEGAAGDSIFDATASSEAAAWEYSRGNYNAWTTNAAFCSMYD